MITAGVAALMGTPLGISATVLVDTIEIITAIVLYVDDKWPDVRVKKSQDLHEHDAEGEESREYS